MLGPSRWRTSAVRPLDDRGQSADDRDATADCHDQMSADRDARFGARDRRADAREQDQPRLDPNVVSDRIGARRIGRTARTTASTQRTSDGQPPRTATSPHVSVRRASTASSPEPPCEGLGSPSWNTRSSSAGSARVLHKCGCPITAYVHVLDVGDTERTATSRQGLAVLTAQHHRCPTPGCDNQHLEVHHIVPWVESRRTDMGNLASGQLRPLLRRLSLTR
jgi:hypothetical protein